MKFSIFLCTKGGLDPARWKDEIRPPPPAWYFGFEIKKGKMIIKIWNRG
jgi:hypothetical protein